MNNTFHVAIIPDGNRRWAKQNGIRGYASVYDRGFDNLVTITESAFEQGVTHLSLWGSSHANIADRSSEFFTTLDKLFRQHIHKFSDHPLIEKYDVKISVIGEWRDSLSPKTVEAFDEAIAKTAHRSSRELVLLVDYSGTRERTAAVQSLLANPSDTQLRAYSWTGYLPDLDLIIRTGSWLDPHNSAGFMNLIADETQYSFPDVLWPDFTSEKLYSAINDFRERERRLGK